MSKLLRSRSTFVLRFVIIFMALLSHPLFLQDATASSADFDGSGVVDISDFLLFVSAFGSGEGQEKYDVKYDLNGDGEIEIADFLIFVNSFGKKVDPAANRVPDFTFVSPVIRSVDESTLSGQNIGDPVSATDPDGDSLTYSLSGPDADSFTIISSSGQIQTKADVTYNYAMKRVYSVTVEVDDGRGGTAYIAVRIGVLSPQLSTTYRQFVEAKENGTEPILPDFSYAGYHYFTKPIPDVTHPIFDVTSYGAIPNDHLSDQRAIVSAIAAAEANGSGIIFFPPGEFLVNTDADNNEPIYIHSSNIVLRGSGSRRGGTVIRQVNPRLQTSNTRYARMFTFIPRDIRYSGLTRITESADRETFWITVADISRLKVGQWITINMNIKSTAGITEFLAPRSLNSLTGKYYQKLFKEGITIHEEHSIAEIQGNRVRLGEPLRTDVNIAYNWYVRSFPHLEEVGVEDISFQTSYSEKFVHLVTKGWSLLKFHYCVNSWIRRTSFVNTTNGLNFTRSAAITAHQVTIAGNPGHLCFTNQDSHGIWIGLSEDISNQYHGPGISHSSTGIVYHRVDMSPKQPIDIHRTDPSYANLYDCVNNGRLSGSSGAGVPPHHLRRLVVWNFNHGGNDTHYDFGRGYLRFLHPIVVGFHGNPATFNESALEVLESNGTAVEPESLFEAQLELRLGTLPAWLNNLSTEWEMLRNTPLSNNPLVARGTISMQTLTVGTDWTLDVSGYFTDPNSVELTYSAASSNEGIATVSVVGSEMTITPVASGSAKITVTARDNRLSTQQTFTVTVVALPPANSAPVATDKIYWSDNGTDKIQRSNLDGSSVEDLVTRSTLRAPVGIALDISGGKIYWIDESTDKIQRSDLDGSSIEDLVTTGLTAPSGIALDISGAKMYWTDRASGKIQRASLELGQGETTRTVEDLVTGVQGVRGIALDISGGKMYWASPVTDKIQRSNLDGSNAEDLITTGLMAPSGIALDISGGKMYWSDRGTDKIQRANLDGRSVDDLVVGVTDPRGIALDISGGKIYWVDNGADKIQRSNLDGSNVEDVITTGLTTPVSIALNF